MVNIGQLVREQHAEQGVVLVGFGPYQGKVIARREWGAPMEELTVPPGREGSWEELLHQAGIRDKLLLLPPTRDLEDLLKVRGHLAIGVVYNPEYESLGNYVPTVLPKRYDAFLYIEKRAPLHPLHIQPEAVDLPETYPWGA